MNTLSYDDDDHERPTVPNPLSFPYPITTPAGAFDVSGQAERFFDAATSDDDEDTDLHAWWADQRRRSMTRYVAVAMAFCAFLLAASAVPR
jgi:hypothetical protein